MFDKPIDTRPYSNHPDDSHLQVVLHKNFKGEYVTHIQNTQDNGFYHGHYFGKDENAYENAVEDYVTR